MIRIEKAVENREKRVLLGESGLPLSESVLLLDGRILPRDESELSLNKRGLRSMKMFFRCPKV